MTIYTPGQIDKDKDSKKVGPEPEVVTEPLTSFKEDDCEAGDQSPKLVRVTYFPKNRRTFCTHMVLAIMVMVMLTIAAIGAVVLYRHLNRHKSTYQFLCPVGSPEFEEAQREWREQEAYDEYEDRLEKAPSPEAHYMEPEVEYESKEFFQEDIRFSLEEHYEELITPSIREVQKSVILHDFASNFSAIVDPDTRRCYLMPLDQSIIAPPEDLLDLMAKLVTGYYFRIVLVELQDYRAVRPQLDDLSGYGRRIAGRCSDMQTYRLEKFMSGVVKRSAGPKAKDPTAVVYAMLGNKIDHQKIYKMVIHGAVEEEDQQDV